MCWRDRSAIVPYNVCEYIDGRKMKYTHTLVSRRIRIWILLIQAGIIPSFVRTVRSVKRIQEVVESGCFAKDRM